jgi:TonB family protein
MVPALVFSVFLSWVQVSSDTYIVKSSAGTDKAQRVLKELESFHQLLGSLVFRNTELPELPIEVLLIGDEQMMKELEPQYNGRRVSVAGYYQRGEDRDFIVLSGDVAPQISTNVVYHELSHYFLSRALKSRPIWLSEGLAEYFANAEIGEDTVLLGGLSQERFQVLKTTTLLPLRDFFSVDSNSPYYNESSKASIYYAEAWAFVHYMMHGEHSVRFKRYLDALTRGQADLLAYLNINERDLETGFQTYVKIFLERPNRSSVKVSPAKWSMDIESIPETEAEMSIAEIFLANGKLDDARRYLEMLAAQAPDSTRVSYYRGVLARIAGEPRAREFFVDALLDPWLGVRAAVQLADMGDWQIPAVRSLLEEAAAMETRNPKVYLALTRIYSDDLYQLEQAVKLKKKADDVAGAKPGIPPIPFPPNSSSWKMYMQGSDSHVQYQVLSESDRKPDVRTVVAPYYPAELLEQKLSGEVTIDVQVTEQGKVGGIWLVSAMPDLFETLATAAVREWEFEPLSTKVRVVLRFKP